MLLSMEYGDLKPHEIRDEIDAFELDHMIAYKQSSKFNSRNILMEVNLENFLPRKLPAIWYMLVTTEALLVATTRAQVNVNRV